MPVDDEDPTREVHQAVDHMLRTGLAGGAAAAEIVARKRDAARQAERPVRDADDRARTATAARVLPVKGISTEQLNAVVLGNLDPATTVAAGQDRHP